MLETPDAFGAQLKAKIAVYTLNSRVCQVFYTVDSCSLGIL